MRTKTVVKMTVDYVKQISEVDDEYYGTDQ